MEVFDYDTFRRNWYQLISHQFVAAALETGAYDLTAVYSRKLATAQEFGSRYGDVEYAIDLETFLVLHIWIRFILPHQIHYILNKRNKQF